MKRAGISWLLLHFIGTENNRCMFVVERTVYPIRLYVLAFKHLEFIPLCVIWIPCSLPRQIIVTDWRTLVVFFGTIDVIGADFLFRFPLAFLSSHSNSFSSTSSSNWIFQVVHISIFNCYQFETSTFQFPLSIKIDFTIQYQFRKISRFSVLKNSLLTWLFSVPVTPGSEDTRTNTHKWYGWCEIVVIVCGKKIFCVSRFGYGVYVALHKGYDKMGSGSDSRYFIYTSIEARI